MLLEQSIESEITEATTTTTRLDTTTQLDTTNGRKHAHKPILEDVDMTKLMRGQRDALRGTTPAAPVSLRNTFIALQTNGEDSDDEDEIADDEDKKGKIDKAQRRSTAARKRRWTSKEQSTFTKDNAF